MDTERLIKKHKPSELTTKIANDRMHTAESVASFAFNENRVRLLSTTDKIQQERLGILYWMFRDARVQDNWACLFAQKLALQRKVPLHICFCLLPTFLEATIRHYKFLLEGLKEVERECKSLNINFHLLPTDEPHLTILKFAQAHKIGAIVTDFLPLRSPLDWVKKLEESIPQDVPLYQVDAHNIVPCWIASEKLEYAARTIRGKINRKLDEFLSQFPPLVKHAYSAKDSFPKNDWTAALEYVAADRAVSEITWARPGYEAGIAELESFLKDRLKIFHSKRNDPLSDANSNLSPWLHFGMISAQRCILEALIYKTKYKASVETFMEELIIRRELSDNFCFYNNDYDTMIGANTWAIDTLNKHRDDKREHVYDLRKLENSLTHDDLWNACQNQLVNEGKMHGYLRMYWAKKILQWTESPEQALQWAVYLNNKYSIDGCDPNGYVGCMWSICGVHDQGWKEREVFGKIRYMNYKGCERKFDVKEFVAKWTTKGAA